MTDTKAIEYLKGFSNIPALDLSMKYPGAGQDAIDFLQKTILFNPFFRLTLQQAIDHPLFEQVKESAKVNTEGKPIDVDFENMELNTDTLKELFL